jgi:hypothetical protein
MRDQHSQLGWLCACSRAARLKLFQIQRLRVTNPSQRLVQNSPPSKKPGALTYFPKERTFFLSLRSRCSFGFCKETLCQLLARALSACVRIPRPNKVPSAFPGLFNHIYARQDPRYIIAYTTETQRIFPTLGRGGEANRG